MTRQQNNNVHGVSSKARGVSEICIEIVRRRSLREPRARKHSEIVSCSVATHTCNCESPPAAAPAATNAARQAL